MSIRPAATPRTTSRGRAETWAPRLLVAGVAVFGVSTFADFRQTTEFNRLLDGWLQGGLYALAAAVCALRPIRDPGERVLWWCITAGLAARALGFVLYLAYIRHLEPIPYPSAADAAWLLTYPLLLAGLVLLARSCLTRLSWTLALDGVVGALATASVGVVALRETLESLTAPGTAPDVVATNLAYPALDLMLLIVLLGVLVSSSWNPPPAVFTLLAGVAGFAVTDAAYLWLVAADEFHPGSPLAFLSLASTSAIALSGRLRDHTDRPNDTLPTLVLPACFVAVCGVVLALWSFRDEPVAVGIAAVGLLVAVVRTSLTFRILRQATGGRESSRTDELTGLPNLRAFREDLAARLRSDSFRGCALAVIDIDEFEAVNARYGFETGDELLRLVAQRMQHSVGTHEICARLGGDQFAVLADRADRGNESGDGDDLVARLRAQLHRPLTIGGATVRITASVGLALAPEDAADAAGLLRRAEIAMRHAKAAAIEHVRYQPEMQRAGGRRDDAVRELEEALAAGAIGLHYQPKVRLQTAEVVGVEALVRWSHPTLGLLPPAAFLSRFEASGLMPRLTRHVLSLALADAATWRRSGDRPTVAINVTVEDLLDPRFPELVASSLADADIPGSALELELTEELFVSDPRRARVAMGALLDQGVRVVLDDYGTGYSSLGYLHGLEEVSGLKIDQTFIRHLDTDTRAQAIVASTLTLARSIGLEAVAEGVETEPARQVLVGLGCELGQGFLFSPPVPADSIRFGAPLPSAEYGA